MSQLAGVVRLLKTEHDRLNRQIQGISSALSAFGAAYGKPRDRLVKDVRRWQGTYSSGSTAKMVKAEGQ